MDAESGMGSDATLVAEVDTPAEPHGTHPDGAGDLAELTAALESADELPLEERLELLKRAEAAISRSLEGLDGL
jgi:hypothetical protein